MAKRSLTSPQVAALRAPGVHRVSEYLYLQVRPGPNGKGGRRSWLFRYQRGGVCRWVGLGPANMVPLGAARDKARKLALDMLVNGVDPQEAVRAERGRIGSPKVKSAAPSFKECAEDYIAAHESGWRNAKHRDQWASTLEMYAYPVFGKLPVDQVDTQHVLKALKPIWTKKAETAHRLRGRIERILDAAKVQGHRDGDNPARWRGHLSHLLPPQKRSKRVKHHAAVSVADAPGLARDIAARDTISAKALLFTMLCAARTGETIGARWDEINLDAASWEIPGERMKSGRAHRVPLSSAAAALLRGLPRGKGYVFPGATVGRHLSNMAMLELMRGLRGQGATVHGLRSTFRDWAAEVGFADEVSEAALAHADTNATRAAYRRTDYFEQRRDLMEGWAKYLLGGEA